MYKVHGNDDDMDADYAHTQETDIIGAQVQDEELQLENVTCTDYRLTTHKPGDAHVATPRPKYT